MPASRSAVVSRLRRAFLLRVHPDRFRASRYDNSVRRRQAELVQALSARLASKDFASYCRPEGGTGWRAGADGAPWNVGGDGGEGSYKGQYAFFLERRDGSLLRLTMNLDDTAENVLKAMADALLSSGAPKSSIPDPPPAPRPSTNGAVGGSANRQTGWAWAPSSSPSSFACSHQRPPGAGIDHRFDVNTNAGRDLLRFLRSPSCSPSLIDRRRSRRLDAHSAALAARRAYGFLSVDGTSVGWSSASLAACLGRLIELKEEYSDKLKVKCFYPLRLVIGYEDGYSDVLDEFRDSLKGFGVSRCAEEGSGGQVEGESECGDPSRAVDLYGGTVTLHPSATSLQWLNALSSVTDESVEIYKSHGERLRKCAKVVKDTLNVKARRGHTCSPREYYKFMGRLAAALEPSLVDEEDGGDDSAVGALTITSSGLSLDEVTHLTVESDGACRRGIVTPEGTVRVGVGMSPQAVLKALSRLGERARRNANVRAEAEGQCRDAINLAKSELGLTSIYRVALGAVSADQTVECLHRLLGKVRGNRCTSEEGGDDCRRGEEMRFRLAGNALGVTGSGRFCHLGDDGSIIIPCDWR